MLSIVFGLSRRSKSKLITFSIQENLFQSAICHAWKILFLRYVEVISKSMSLRPKPNVSQMCQCNCVVVIMPSIQQRFMVAVELTLKGMHVAMSKVFLQGQGECGELVTKCVCVGTFVLNSVEEVVC